MRFHPGCQVVVADGSTEEYKSGYRHVIDRASSTISVDYRSYSHDLPFFDRIVDALESLDTDLAIMGADDDYPVLDTLAKAEAFLVDNDDYVTAQGCIVHLRLAPDGRMHARLGQACPQEDRAAIRRVMSYAQWPYSTTYAVTRRSHLIERYKRASRHFLARFHDFTVGVHDCTMGKLKAFGEIGYFCTRNPNHSYLRADDPLVYLRRSCEVLNLLEVYYADLMEHANRPEPFIRKSAIKLINLRIEELAGCRAHLRPGFESSPLFADQVIQSQYFEFHGLFSQSHPARERLFHRLRYIVDTLREQGTSTSDNRGESPSYETLDQQLGLIRPVNG